MKISSLLMHDIIYRFREYVEILYAWDESENQFYDVQIITWSQE